MTQPKNGFRIHDKASAPEAAKPILEKVEKGFGFVPNVLGVTAESPAALEAYVTLNQILQDKTALSTEEFVNVAWDSAGVTTGPVTVPLVLAMGLGVGDAVRASDGFGVLALASLCPIASVLVCGLIIRARERRVSPSTEEAHVRP